MLSFGGVYQYDTTFPDHSLATLAAACSGLRKLSVEIEVGMLVDKMEGPPDAEVFKPTSPTALVKKLKWEPLFLLQTLRHLTVVTEKPQSFLSIVHDAPQRDILAHLKIAIRNRFKAAGKTDKVDVKFIELVGQEM